MKNFTFLNGSRRKKMTFKKFINILKPLLLLCVIATSGVGMLNATTPWLDTIWTCIWCLSLVILVDRLD